MATIAMKAKMIVMIPTETGRIPVLTTSRSAASDSASWAIGTVMAAVTATRT